MKEKQIYDAVCSSGLSCIVDSIHIGKLVDKLQRYPDEV